MSLLLLLGGAGVTTSTAAGGAGPGDTTVILEWSPTTNPMEPPVWEDITPYLRSTPGVSIRRGRNEELDEFQAGTASLTLNNRTRLFDPTNTAGDYYGLLKPFRRFRLSLRYAGITYTRFVGFNQGWPQHFDISKREAYVPLELVDGFGLLSQADMTEAVFTWDDATDGIWDQARWGGDSDITEELSGARVESVLDLVGWSDADRNVDTGVSTLNSTHPSGSALEYLKNVEQSEGGWFYISRDGKATFVDRNAQYTEARITTSNATFSDDGADKKYADLVYEYDIDRVYNDVRRTRDGGTEQAADDADSIDSYFRRVHSVTGLLLTSDAEALDIANLFLQRYSEPQVRLPTLTVKPLRDPSVLLPATLAREVLDRVTVEHTPMNLGAQNAHEVLIEGYTETWTASDIRFDYQLSPVVDVDAMLWDVDNWDAGVWVA